MMTTSLDLERDHQAQMTAKIQNDLEELLQDDDIVALKLELDVNDNEERTGALSPVADLPEALIWASNEDMGTALLRPLLRTPNGTGRIREVSGLRAHHAWTVAAKQPIGLCVLADGHLILSETGSDSVWLLERATGRRVRAVLPSRGRSWKRPSDVTALADGRFAVRDNMGIQLFDEVGEWLLTAGEGRLGRCFGLAADARGHLLTLNTNFFGTPTRNPTQKGQTDLLLLSVETGAIVQRIELCDVIRDPARSKCRFLHCRGTKLYVVDLGLDQIYIMDLIDHEVRLFGGSGRGHGQFSDPAGLVTDRQGTMLVADSRNHRVQVFDGLGQFLGLVDFEQPIQRPSGIVLDYDPDGRMTLYVLNLWEASVVKYFLT